MQKAIYIKEIKFIPFNYECFNILKGNQFNKITINKYIEK